MKGSPTWTGLGEPVLVIDRLVLVVVVADAVAGATRVFVPGTKALAVAVLSICPAAMSAWVTMWVAVHV